MSSDPEIVAGRPGALSFEPQPYPSTYLHPVRVDDAFVRHLGDVEQYALLSERTTGTEGGVTWILSIKGKEDLRRGQDITFNLQKPLVRALVLRAHLQREGRHCSRYSLCTCLVVRVRPRPWLVRLSSQGRWTRGIA